MRTKKEVLQRPFGKACQNTAMLRAETLFLNIAAIVLMDLISMIGLQPTPLLWLSEGPH